MNLALNTKINSKWLKDFDVRLDTAKLLKETIGKTFFDINSSSIFLGQSTKARMLERVAISFSRETS